MMDLNALQKPEVLNNASIEELKASLLELVAQKDEEPVATKVRFLNDNLLPLFEALAERNPTPDVTQQIPLVQGLWHSVWSTIPFQDILPGRVRAQSYQIFADNGLYANMARYRPGHKKPLLNWLSRWLLSYDLMILQTYAVSEDYDAERAAGTGPVAQHWDIENVGIRQLLRFGPAPLDAQAAIAWFQTSLNKYQQSEAAKQALAMPTNGISRTMQKRYEKVSKAKPQLEHLYIDRDFRLVKSIREKTQRPSYTIAVRIADA
ncbi:MAG: hypothetical protein AAF050_19595 [Cyanobacteria bacterium J06649_5]